MTQAQTVLFSSIMNFDTICLGRAEPRHFLTSAFHRRKPSTNQNVAEAKNSNWVRKIIRSRNFFLCFFFLITRPSTMSKYKLGTLKIFKLLYIHIRSQHLLSRPATHFLNASRWFIPSVFHSSELWVSWCISAEFRLMNHVCTISSSIIKRSYKRSAKLQIRETVNNTFRVRLI